MHFHNLVLLALASFFSLHTLFTPTCLASALGDEAKDNSQPIQRAMPAPPVNSWEETFTLINGSQLTRTSHIIQFGFLHSSTINITASALNGMQLKDGKLILELAMSRDEFIAEMVRAGIYAAPINQSESQQEQQN